MNGRNLTVALLVCGVVGPPLFVLVFLIEGFTRPGYSPWRHFVSQLALSDQGWEQIANFIVTGLLMFAFAVGLRRALRSGRGATWGPILIGVYALCLLIAGIFVTDPGLGYPPNAYHTQTLHDRVHGVASLLVFTSLTVACFVMARRFAADPATRGWAIYSLITGLVVILCFAASAIASVLDETGTLPNAPTGLIHRISIIAGWTWVSLLALHLLNKARSVEYRTQ